MITKLRALTIGAVLAVMALVAVSLPAQTLITNTTLSAAATATTRTVSLTSASGTAVGSFLYVDYELMLINGISGTTITVQRGQGGTGVQAHASAAVVLVGAGNLFRNNDPPYGKCVNADYPATSKPWVNVVSGNVWLCRFGSGGVGTWQATNQAPITYGSLTLQ